VLARGEAARWIGPAHFTSVLHRSVTFSDEQSGPFPGAVTGTALWIAAARARESDRPDPLFVDPWAAALAGPDGRDRLVASEQTSGRENPFIPVRTRFFDDLLTAATWAEQVVLLGAGMDTRAYRLNLPPDTVVFELDHPDIFMAKNTVLKDINPRCQRREVSADLGGQWEPELEDAGFDKARRTVWLAEGLFFYLTEDAVRGCCATPHGCAGHEPSSAQTSSGPVCFACPACSPSSSTAVDPTNRYRSALTARASCWQQADGAWTPLSAWASPRRTLVDYLMSPLTGTVDPTPRWAPT
jgi:Leucine carboxyl methyltransferase